MKIALIVKVMGRMPEKVSSAIVHTGQHYDEEMSKICFDELDIPRPNIE